MHRSSVEDYAMIEEKLGSDDKEEPGEKLTGYLQREYKKFLEEHDPDKGWGGLSRHVMDDGEGMWCCAACCKKLAEGAGAETDA